MLDGTAQLGGFVLSQCWRFFGVQVPGFGFTFAQMLFGIAICVISLMVLKVFFGIGGRAGGMVYRASSSRRPKISENRKGDEK